jgi:hypothetical protein
MPKPLKIVSPAKAGVRVIPKPGNFLDSGFCRNDVQELNPFSKNTSARVLKNLLILFD